MARSARLPLYNRTGFLSAVSVQAIALLVCLACLGCEMGRAPAASPPVAISLNRAGMVADIKPDSSFGASPFARKTVDVPPVAGSEPSFLTRGERVSNKDFHWALVTALQKSSMFAAVTDTGSSDYVLQATVADQQVGDAMASIDVTYVLTEAHQGSQVF